MSHGTVVHGAYWKPPCPFRAFSLFSRTVRGTELPWFLGSPWGNACCVFSLQREVGSKIKVLVLGNTFTRKYWVMPPFSNVRLDRVELQTSRSKTTPHQRNPMSVSSRLSFRSFSSLFSFRKSRRETSKLLSPAQKGWVKFRSCDGSLVIWCQRPVACFVFRMFNVCSQALNSDRNKGDGT